MTDQLIPSYTETLVQLCCEEFSAAGADAVVTGANTYLTSAVPGLYAITATVPYTSTAWGSDGVTAVSDGDDATDLNDVSPTSLPWGNETASGPSFFWVPIGGDPAQVHVGFEGMAFLTVMFGINGTAGDVVGFKVLKNGLVTIPGSVFVEINADGDGAVNFTATDESASIGDTYEVVGQAVGVPSGPATVDVTVFSTWLCQRVVDPLVGASLQVFDLNDVLIRTVDTDAVSGYRGSVRLGAYALLPAGGRVKAMVSHDFGVSDLVAASTVHMDMHYVAAAAVQQDCPVVGGGGG